MLWGGQVSFSQTLCTGGQLLTPSQATAPQRATLADALSPTQPLLPATAACTVSLVACRRTSAAEQPQLGQLPLQLWAGDNVQRSSGVKAQLAGAPGKCDRPGGGRAASEAENAGRGAAHGTQYGLGEGPPLLRDLVRRLTYERPSVLDGVMPPSTAVRARVLRSVQQQYLPCLAPDMMSGALNSYDGTGVALGQVRDRALEQDFRECYHNCKLARSWRGGAPWAALDFNGLELTAAAAAAAEERYSQARSLASCTAGSSSAARGL